MHRLGFGIVIRVLRVLISFFDQPSVLPSVYLDFPDLHRFCGQSGREFDQIDRGLNCPPGIWICLCEQGENLAHVPR